MHRRQFFSFLPVLPLWAAAHRGGTSAPWSAHGSRQRRMADGFGSGTRRPVIFVGATAADVAATQLPSCQAMVCPQTQDLKKIITTLDRQDAVLVGESAAATVVLNYLAQFGDERVAGLALLGVSPALLQPYRAVMAATGVPTLLAYRQHEVMVPLPPEEQLASTLGHVELVALQPPVLAAQDSQGVSQALARFVARV